MNPSRFWRLMQLSLPFDSRVIPVVLLCRQTFTSRILLSLKAKLMFVLAGSLRGVVVDCPINFMPNVGKHAKYTI